jgi:hypothetical protein
MDSNLLGGILGVGLAVVFFCTTFTTTYVAAAPILGAVCLGGGSFLFLLYESEKRREAKSKIEPLPPPR